MISHFCNEYTLIHQFACLTESAMSLQVFFLTCSYFSDLFSLFSNVLGFYTKHNGIFIVAKVVSTTLNFASFICIAYTAAGVNEKDQKLRKGIKEISFKLRCSDDTKRDGKLLLEFITSKEKLIFTANGIFTFTKSLILASASVFLSYNLLLLQLDTKM
ncbi:hypothetical protein AVEN_224877-1 [Araneus ventricosus]|uniref:Gustatory receptor 28b n=1 Tax=Araneus ventricosus TaxID=182803 RepID=A0A4Y2GV17_ARAVE|nr:hypothetical protein AVEN_224877-1 [Araneus ventricosus]